MRPTDSTLPDWFHSPLGDWLLESEKRLCQSLIPAGYYPSAVQIGMGHVDMLDQVETGASVRVRVSDPNPDGSRASPPEGTESREVLARASALPFGQRSCSLIVLPHQLDFCDDPHSVLREIHQILIPEGCIVISGFNRFSLWGAGGMWRRRYRRAPWSGRFSRPGQIQDWLSLLGYDVVGAQHLGYAPPLQKEKWRQRFAFMEKAGDRWWPAMGAAFVIVGRKREIAAVASDKRPAWQQFIPAIARPAVQSGSSASRGGRAAVGRGHLRLVHSNAERITD